MLPGNSFSSPKVPGWLKIRKTNAATIVSEKQKTFASLSLILFYRAFNQ
jgi:hypothetical protein